MSNIAIEREKIYSIVIVKTSTFMSGGFLYQDIKIGDAL